MDSKQWVVYNHALIPNIAPNILPDDSVLDSNEIWKYKHPLFARWITEWDCGKQTDWWYVIKDECFDISKLKSKRRYEIKKGRRHFSIKVIDASKFKSDIYDIQVCAYSQYPAKYRPKVVKEKFLENIDSWKESIVFGAFDNNTGELVGYARLEPLNELFVNFKVLKTKPKFERYGVNAAMVDGILMYLQDFFDANGILSDGSRNIKHETNFQDYLIKYFGFRKAYCKLNIKYKPLVKVAVHILYPLRGILKKFDNIRPFHLVNGVMLMEGIIRSQKGQG